MELDLSSLGAVNTMFAALFSKLGVPIKTTVSATVLEEALNGMVAIRPLPLGQPITRKVRRYLSFFFFFFGLFFANFIYLLIFNRLKSNVLTSTLLQLMKRRHELDLFAECSHPTKASLRLIHFCMDLT